MSGTYEALVDYDETPRDQALRAARAAAIEAAVEAGAVRGKPSRSSIPKTFRCRDYPGHTNRVR